MAKELILLEMRDDRQWRAWLRAHHASSSGIWLVRPKAHTGRKSIAYEDAVRQALCFGWIDSLVKRLDDERYARKFTPRKPDSAWSAINRRRYANLEAAGRLAPPGVERAPTDRTSVAPPRSDWSKVPSYIAQALGKRPAARKHFESLAPSHKRAYIGWIDSAKREDTKLKRLKEAIGLLAAGKKLGLK